MAHTSGEVIQGQDLMVKFNTGTAEQPEYTAQAMATNHVITYNSETKDRLTKDQKDGNPLKRITKTTVQIKTDGLRSFGDTQKKMLLAALKSKQNVLLQYGFAEEVVGDEYEEGEFVIDSLEETSQAGEDVTWTAQFTSSGTVETKSKTS